MPSTDAYDTVKSTPSRMDYPYAHGMYYKSCLLSILVVFTLIDILGLSIFVFGGNKEHKNGTLNVVDFSIFS